MHEVSLVAALVDQVQDVAQKENFNKVISIRLKVGALSGVDLSCLQFCFSEVTKDTILAGAHPIFEWEGIILQCQVCGQSSSPSDPAALFCVHCQSGQIVINQGKEFKIMDLEVI